MKVKANVIDELLSPLNLYAKKDILTRQEVNENPPLRAELFSIEQMEQHALQLAAHHSITVAPSTELLLKELSENERILFQVNELLQRNVREKKSISPAAEWLLDNFYLIEDQIRIAKRHLPKGYSKGLPKLTNSEWAGFPRVYNLAVEIISHSDGHIDITLLSSFITAYQREQHLTLGELWAFPIMLRLALIENLSRVAGRIAVDRNDTALANKWARLIVDTAENNAKDLVLVIADMARSNPPMASAFIAEFARKLQWKGMELTLPLHWIEQQLSKTEDTINSMVLVENQKQAADQVSVSNSINSLRFLAKTDWRDFVESTSIVEQTLRNDIFGVYARMDFHTRDQYRHTVEEIAANSGLSESDVARIAIDLARKSYNQNSTDERRSHVGYYLLDNGVKQTEEEARVKLPTWKALKKNIKESSGGIYVLTSLLITLLLAAVMTWIVIGEVNWWVVAGVGFLSLITASHFALSLANWWCTLWMKPLPLPKLDFSLGIPGECRTMVVVPTLLVNAAQVEKLVEELEVRFLSNRDNNLSFALLTDFTDAPLPHMPEDELLVKLAQKRIIELNQQYSQSLGDLFFLFHRPRTWNKVDNLWMGHERKRGKLSDLNGLLKGRGKEKFSVIVGDEQIYRTVKYIITLDTDTQLPRDAAWKLVGLMAHPLNRPTINEQMNRVDEGYAIVQPRIAISLHGATRSGFTRLYENDLGIDPYTRVTSNIYQDLFQEGSFIGKGIYDIDAFDRVLENRFPENRILSHDLLEGCYARCGFASDIQFYEDYPPRYQMDMRRRHRWIRGDWQIANWFLPVVPGLTRADRNPLSTLSRWKIFDNLRRSLLPLAQLALLIAGWTILPYPWLWTLLIPATILIPSVITSLWSSVQKPREIALTQHISNAVGLTSKNILQAVFLLVCLPYEAFMSADAIVKTLWRMFITKRKLLQWDPFTLTSKNRTGILKAYQSMWIAPLFSLGMFALLISKGWIEQAVLAAPMLITWILSPAVVAFLDRPLLARKSKLNEYEQSYLRELARKSWAFFETFVGPDDRWLPPDNLQQYPIPVLAHRTSPTNIGLAILANLSACDFGYITTTQLIERTTNTFATMDELERYQGHFFNWYDTHTLGVLNPRYISTVDSGNLAGHLLTFKQGLLSLPNQKIVGPQVLRGLQDTLRIALEEIVTNENGLRTALRILHDGIRNWHLHLYDLKEDLEKILWQFKDLINEAGLTQNWWCLAFERHVTLIYEEIKACAPWVEGPPIPEKFKNWKSITQVPTLAELAVIELVVRPEINRWRALENTEPEIQWLNQLDKSIRDATESARSRMVTLQWLASKASEFSEMDYNFLYDKSQRLLSVGYNVAEHHCDLSYYDLLASEARLSSFVAIAQGKIPQESWFALGRRLTTVGRMPVLLSWSGSMFEYLMPGLVMPTYENTLLDEMCAGMVIKQMEYGDQQGVPWGISESCYNVVDAHLTYQYRAFGVPGLGFKRGLGQDLVIAPYATILALMVNPESAYANLQKMKSLGFEGQYGFYEAIDYTPTRLSRERPHAVIKTFMVHHQGMSLLALAYVLLDKPMQKRFEADTQFQTALLLLQEQVPKSVGYYSGSTENEKITPASSVSDIRVIQTPNTAVPEVQLLSNGRYHVMLSNSGGGYSRWREMAVTRWRPDTTLDNWGTFCYIHDDDKNEFWSNTYQPTLQMPEQYEAIFSQGKVEFRRKDDGIESYTTIIVSPEDDVEVRRIQLINNSQTSRMLTVTSYGEVVLATAAADDAHTSFSNLFVQTEINEHQHAITCTRRPRSKEERPPWMFHLIKVSGAETRSVSYETDRSLFIGRNGTLGNPLAMNGVKPLTGSQGSVLDPVVSIQYRLTLKPGETAVVDLVTGMAETSEGVQGLIDKYQDKHLRDRAFELSWTHSQVVLRQIGATEADAQLFGKLASSILYVNSFMRAPASTILKNQRQQPALWSHAISGDLPIVLLIVSHMDNISIVKQLIKAKVYWQMKGLAVDLVILNEDSGGYRQVLQEQILGLVAAGMGVASTERQGRIFVRPIDQVSTEDQILFQAVARVIISDRRGSLEEQVNKLFSNKSSIAKIVTTRSHGLPSVPVKVEARLQFFNGTGGFSADGREYVILSEYNKRTPLPWINVLANPNFGTILSESGSSYTWFENAHEFRLTPWKNDPILDSSGEAFYIRDDESGRFWSPMGRPAGRSPFIARHGFGYSSFQRMEEGILSEVTIHVDRERPVKFITLKITNQSDQMRKLTASGYVEWILGDLNAKSGMHIFTEFDPERKAIIARNRYSVDFHQYVSFFAVDDGAITYTADRTEFIGRNRTLANPDAMNRVHLSGKSGGCLDPCAAFMVPVVIDVGQSRTIVFKLGAGKDIQDVRSTLQQCKGSIAATQSLSKTKEFWADTLQAVQVETPDASIDILANGWLLYQVLSCRLWGRSGLYQSGGAFGFRDQLQDVLSVVHAKSELTRQQILLCASRQFKEGDVQHWWHPPTGRGVRTRCSDDYLWLPFVASRYVFATGDLAILSERVPFLEGRSLNVDEESYYDSPVTSDKSATVYEHCKQSILHGLTFGEHGLPLIGSGDWNDGMNMVGIHGRGESVWLAFFLFDVLNRFAKVAESQGDHEFVEQCVKEAKQLKKNIKNHAWEGQWYLRAFFDDASPLGSAQNDECKIDALSQSWSVLSGGGEAQKSQTAMQAVNDRLINREKGLIQLLDPPFDKSEMDPGYIKGYVPGVRENGGQYSHAAIWMVMAFAKLGDRERTMELLNMINPIHHGDTAEKMAVYKTEPYVMAADVYGVTPHAGRGGWTWYTGSAGWMYQLIMESFLGLRREGDSLKFKPCIPKEWKSFTVRYRFQETDYTIVVKQQRREHDAHVVVDGKKQSGQALHLVNDKAHHEVVIWIGDTSVAKNVEATASNSVEKFPDNPS